MKPFDITSFRAQFPILSQRLHGLPLVYFDNGATTQKPACVIEAETNFYHKFNANVHRAAHQLSAYATNKFEQARQTVQSFINAKYSHEIIWTKGTTEAINLVAQSWGTMNLSAGDEIVLTYAEHHANIVPWQIIAQQKGALIKVLDLNESGVVDEASIECLISAKTKIVCFSHISNVIGKINPIERIIAKAKAVGAVTLIDGAQAIAHTPVDVQALDCDFYVFSSHKMYGPTGLGVLYGKQVILNKMPPYQGGGEMIKKVSFINTTYNSLPYKFEAGTPNIAGVIGLEAAVHFIQTHQLITPLAYKKILTDYCFKQLSLIGDLQFLARDKPDIPLFSFLIKGHHQQDIAINLDLKAIGIRVGHHCAMPLMEYLNVGGAIRVSLAPYNTLEEVDFFISVLRSIIQGQESHCGNDILSTTNEKKALTKSDEIISLFIKAKSWDSKHREIMLLGKSLARMDRRLRNQNTLISGCESAAWLSVTQSKSGLFFIEADSDAKVIRGLLVIILAAFNEKTAEQIASFDLNQYFESLGLMRHLSPSRGNGVLAIVDKIQQAVL